MKYMFACALFLSAAIAGNGQAKGQPTGGSIDILINALNDQRLNIRDLDREVDSLCRWIVLLQRRVDSLEKVLIEPALWMQPRINREPNIPPPYNGQPDIRIDNVHDSVRIKSTTFPYTTSYTNEGTIKIDSIGWLMDRVKKLEARPQLYTDKDGSIWVKGSGFDVKLFPLKK